MTQKETAAPAGTGNGDDSQGVHASIVNGLSGSLQHPLGHEQTAARPSTRRIGFIAEFAARMYAMRTIRAHVLGGAA